MKLYCKDGEDYYMTPITRNTCDLERHHNTKKYGVPLQCKCFYRIIHPKEWTERATIAQMKKGQWIGTDNVDKTLRFATSREKLLKSLGFREINL